MYMHFTSLLKARAKVNTSAAEMFHSWIDAREPLLHLGIHNAILTHTGHCLVYNERVRQKQLAADPKLKFQQGGAFASTLAALRRSDEGGAILVPQRNRELPEEITCTPYAPRRVVYAPPPDIPDPLPAPPRRQQ
jgi:hypothetical protein